MLAAYDLDNRSSAVLPQTVQRLGFKPSRRVEIMTTGRSRRRRHRGGTREEEEAARQRDERDERAARRAAQAEREEQELSVLSQLDELVPDPDSDDDDVIALLESSDVAALQTDEEEAVADNPQVSGRPAAFASVDDDDDDVLREDPVRRSLSQQLDEEAIAAAQDVSFDAQQFLTAAFEQAAQSGVDVSEPYSYYETMQDAIGDLPMGQQIEAYAQLKSELSRLANARIDQRLRDSDPEEFARLTDERDYFAAAADDIQDRIEQVRARLAQRAVARTPAAGDTSPVFQRRGQARSPSPI